MLSNGTIFYFNYVLYSRKFTRNLLSFKNIYINGYHIETMNESNTKCHYISFIDSGKKLVVEKLSTISFGLYQTTINHIE